MLKISEVSLSDKDTKLNLEGRITGPWVAEVQRVCEELISSGHSITLDLAEVSFVDRSAIALLQRLVKRQVILTRCSPFLTEQLREIHS